MAKTYEPIATTTIATAVSSYTFSSIPATYTDLVLANSIKLTLTPNAIAIRFNSDTTTNYSYTYLAGDGSAASSGRGTSANGMQLDYITTTANFGSGRINVFNYANTTTYKTVVSRQDYAPAYVTAYVGLWRKTPEAITSITIYPVGGNFEVGSTFTLYGIKAA